MRRVIARSRLGMMMAVASPSGATSIASKPQRRFVTAQPSSAVLVSRPSGGLFAATPIRLCSSTASSAGVTLTPQQIALAIETAAQPLYTLIASGADAETIAEDLLKRTQERLDRAEDSAKVANPTAQDIIDGGLQIVEAEALAQIGLSDHAIGVVEMALRQLTPLLPEQSYYIARAKCLKARLLSQLGQPQQAVETLRGLVPAKAENGAKLSFEDAPSEADGLLLAAFIHSGNATLSEAAEALSHLHMAMKALDEAEAAAVRAADASKDKVEGKILANMEQAKETARSMRVALIVDCAVAQSTVGDFEEALKSLEGAEAAVKALVGATEDSAIAEHPAMADIDYHRAVALATMGRVEEGAVKAAVARRIITSNSPTAFDKIAQAAEVECRCLASMNEGAFAISALDQVIKHIKGISENPNTPDRLVEEGKRSVRKLLVLRLSIIDDRAQHHEIVKAVDAMLPDMEGTSKEGLLFIKMRRAQALAPCGNSWEESLDALHAVRKEAETVLPARIPDIHLSVAVVHLAQGDEAKAMQMRSEVLSTLPEDARSEHNEAEWRFAAAMLALARGNTEVAVAQGEKAVQGMDPRVASSLMAPLYFAAGNHAEAHKRAAQCLQASATAQATPDGTGLRVDKGMAELVAISVLTWPEQQSDEALAKGRGQVQAALAVLKADARLLEVARYEAAMHKKFGTASA